MNDMHDGMLVPTTPAPVDGFAKHQSEKRVIRGQIIKFIDGRTTVGGEPFASNTPLLVQDIARIGQTFFNDIAESFYVDEENPISKIDELNASISEKDWRIGLSGAPEPPWRLNFVIYFVNERNGACYTMINSTTGMRIATDNLCNQVAMTRKLRGVPVLPIVKISSMLMKTKFGTKSRVSFDVIGWKGLAGGDAQPLLKQVASPTAGEIIDDGIPF